MAGFGRMVLMIFPDARVDCVHHIEPAYCSQGIAEIVLHELNQFIGVSLCGDSIVPRLLCARSSCFSSSLLLFGFPALSKGALEHLMYPVVVDARAFQKATGFKYEVSEVETLKRFAAAAPV